MHGEIAGRMRHLVVSTPAPPPAVGDQPDDRRFSAQVDRLPIPVHRAHRVTNLIRWSGRAGKLVRQHRIGFVLCGNLKPAGYVACWVYRRYGIRYGVYCHGGDVLSELQKIRASPAKRRLAKSIFAGASAVVANSRWTAATAMDLLRELDVEVPEGRVRVVRPGADPERFRPRIENGTTRARYDIPDGPLLLTVARLHPHKGVAAVLRALRIMTSRGMEVSYAVVGDGPQAPALKDLARELGVSERVRWLGVVPEGDLAALYNCATLYVGISTRAETIGVEGFGISFLEASACGIAVVAGRSAGVVDAVRDGETGVLVDPHVPEELAEVVEGLLTDRARREALGAAGRRAVEEYFNWDRVVRDVEEVADRFSDSD